jgi:DNA-binding response OmpR family regulator
MKTPEQIEVNVLPLASTVCHQHMPAHEDCAVRQIILLVEDDRSIRRYLEVILQKAGYMVITAGDGLEAMKVAMTTHVDAVVTDAIMPHINGHELCRFLKSQPTLSSLPVILLSGLENVQTNMTDNGANVYMAKPVSPTELINRLEQLL